MQDFQPTHRIYLFTANPSPTETPYAHVDVCLIDGAAYTRDEWRASAPAAWELVDGEWLFQGRVPPHGYYVTRCIGGQPLRGPVAWGEV